MHPYSFLKAKVQASALAGGFRLASESLHPDDFGSCLCIFERAEFQLRLVWDGKEGVGFLESRIAAEPNWRAVGRVLSESEIEGSPHDVAAISAWEADLHQVVL